MLEIICPPVCEGKKGLCCFLPVLYERTGSFSSPQPVCLKTGVKLVRASPSPYPRETLTAAGWRWSWSHYWWILQHLQLMTDSMQYRESWSQGSCFRSEVARTGFSVVEWLAVKSFCNLEIHMGIFPQPNSGSLVVLHSFSFDLWGDRGVLIFGVKRIKIAMPCACGSCDIVSLLKQKYQVWRKSSSRVLEILLIGFQLPRITLGCPLCSALFPVHIFPP